MSAVVVAAYRKSNPQMPDDITFEEKGEVRINRVWLAGSHSSVSSAVILASLLVGSQPVSNVGFDLSFGANVVAEWRLLQKRPARTALGARLMSIRERIVKSGAPLLDWDDIEREVAERRGEAA